MEEEAARGRRRATAEVPLAGGEGRASLEELREMTGEGGR
jgi:hypothetical protein